MLPLPQLHHFNLAPTIPQKFNAKRKAKPKTGPWACGQFDDPQTVMPKMAGNDFQDPRGFAPLRLCVKILP